MPRNQGLGKHLSVVSSVRITAGHSPSSEDPYLPSCLGRYHLTGGIQFVLGHKQYPYPWSVSPVTAGLHGLQRAYYGIVVVRTPASLHVNAEK